MLPFSRADFLEIFAAYNASAWPVALALWFVVAVLAIAYVRGTADRTQPIVVALAVNWLWSGIVYHAGFFARINPIAVGFGAVFVVEAVLLLWTGLRRPRFHIVRRRTVQGAVADAVLLYGLLYPGIVWLTGERYPRMPTFGLPCPTTLVTIGFLLAADRIPARAVVVPVLWGLIAWPAAFLLDIRADAALPFAAAALLVMTVYQGVHHAHDHTERLVQGHG